MSTDDGPDEVRLVRLARNQALYREVNERVEAISRQFGRTGPLSLMCECPNPDCAAHLTLTVDEYEAVRADPTCFVVLPGHVYEDVEVVVDTAPTHVVVSKIDVAAHVAKVSDPRRPR